MSILKLKYKIILFIGIILSIVILSINILTLKQVEKTVETQMGNNAMDLAQTVASMDIIKNTLGKTRDYNVIQNTVENLRKKTRFQYIIVMNMDGVVCSYPFKDALGKVYRNGGAERGLKYGEAYISADRNRLISAIRAVVPIYYEGKQVGVVLVGLLNDTVNKEISTYIFNFKFIFWMGLLLGIVGAILLSYNIRKAIFGLEPKEIALLLGERDLVLENLKYAILATNEKGEITFFNKSTKLIFGFTEEDKFNKMSKYDYNFAEQIHNVLITKKPIYNQEITIDGGITLLCSHTLLKNHKNDIIGVVSSFQDLTEVKQMGEEIIGINKMTNELRAQNHEFMNKLHTISGLIQLEKYDKVIEYIQGISHENQTIISIINKRIKNPHVAGILLAKYYKATEAKISLEIDENSYMDKIPSTITDGELCSIIGNIIENAIDELVKRENGKIYIKINSDNKNLMMVIKNNGRSISEKIKGKIYERGVTTKVGKRGFGLWIIKQIIDKAKGQIKFHDNNLVTWQIHIPFERSYEDD